MADRSDYFVRMEAAVVKASAVGAFVTDFCAEGVVAYATFQMVSLANNQLAVPYVKTTYPQEWVRHYLLNDLMRVDPVVRMAKDAKGPFFWSEVALSHPEKQMMERAQKFGISITGFTVPTSDIGPYRGLFSFCAPKEEGEGWCDLVRAHLRPIGKIASHLHSMARLDLDPYDYYSVNLSAREIECLRYISAGKTHTDIADILGISEHTVRSYCRSMRLKLNCSTLAQAVAKACAMGLI